MVLSGDQREKLRADLYWLLGFEEDKNLSMSGPPGTWVKIIILRIVTMITTLVMQVRRMKTNDLSEHNKATMI